MKKLLKKKDGFTLIELMIVVAIIGVLAAIAIPAFSNYLKKAKTAEAPAQLKGLFTSAATYYLGEKWNTGVLAEGAAAAALVGCTVTAGQTSVAPSGSKNQLDWSTEGGGTFKAMGFSIADPVYFQYSANGGTGMCDGTADDVTVYTFIANGDLDGDGTTSTFRLDAGSDRNNELKRAPSLRINNDLE